MDAHAAAVRAPDFVPGLDWVNSPSMSLVDFRGRIVILDFWTGG